MARMHRAASLSIALISVFAVNACKKKPAVAPAPAPAPQPNADSIRLAEEQRRRDSIAAAQASAAEAARRAREDSIARANAAAAAEASNLRAILLTVINFDYDKSDLRDDARAALDAKVPVLMANAGVRLRIAGHTDERGSTEYNLALGQRRATAAKAYLTSHGVPDDRIETVSFGEERPVAQGSDEAAYAQNRRDEFEIITGGDRLIRPRTQ
jgi:peptidoglycan-associated lipoprotein